jgi:hypothetical protein
MVMLHADFSRRGKLDLSPDACKRNWEKGPGGKLPERKETAQMDSVAFIA